jgi:SAM-dependent methyltransferase
MVDDELVRAAVEGFAGFHTGLYRDLAPVLAGDLRRRDVTEQGALIARLSEGFEPFVLGELDRLATELRPRRVVDVGCGAGVHLATVLAAAPDAEGVGLDVDAGAVDLAVATLERAGLSGRARVVRGDVREVDPAALGGPAELVLLANVVYYVPRGERVALFRRLAGLLAPGGTLLVMTTVAAPTLFSRHFDLLLRAQEGAMELPDAGVLRDQLTAAGFAPGPVRPLAPGLAVVGVVAPRAR